MSLSLAEEALRSEVIDAEVHARLVKDIESVARRANLPPKMLWTSMQEYCTEDEIEYVKQLKFKRDKGVLGLVYVGHNEHKPILERMSAAAAACIRNRINAQIMVVTDVIRETQQGTLPNPTVLMIPNFFMGGDDNIPKWRSGPLLDMLYSRQQENLQTFLYVRDLKEMGSTYGDSFVDHLERFDMIPA